MTFTESVLQNVHKYVVTIRDLYEYNFLRDIYYGNPIGLYSTNPFLAFYNVDYLLYAVVYNYSNSQFETANGEICDLVAYSLNGPSTLNDYAGHLFSSGSTTPNLNANFAQHNAIFEEWSNILSSPVTYDTSADDYNLYDEHIDLLAFVEYDLSDYYGSYITIPINWTYEGGIVFEPEGIIIEFNYTEREHISSYFDLNNFPSQSGILYITKSYLRTFSSPVQANQTITLSAHSNDVDILIWFHVLEAGSLKDEFVSYADIVQKNLVYVLNENMVKTRHVSQNDTIQSEYYLCDMAPTGMQNTDNLNAVLYETISSDTQLHPVSQDIVNSVINNIQNGQYFITADIHNTSYDDNSTRINDVIYKKVVRNQIKRISNIGYITIQPSIFSCKYGNIFIKPEGNVKYTCVKYLVKQQFTYSAQQQNEQQIETAV
jgi:hypothetical protein